MGKREGKLTPWKGKSTPPFYTFIVLNLIADNLLIVEILGFCKNNVYSHHVYFIHEKEQIAANAISDNDSFWFIVVGFLLLILAKLKKSM